MCIRDRYNRQLRTLFSLQLQCYFTHVHYVYKEEIRQKEGLFRKEQYMEREQIFQNTLVKHYGLPLVEGSLAGLIATVPMTTFMLAVQRILPQWQQYALPPEKLTDEFAKRVGLRKHMDKQQLLIASFVSHLGFGVAAGAMYGPLTRICLLYTSDAADE